MLAWLLTIPEPSRCAPGSVGGLSVTEPEAERLLRLNAWIGNDAQSLRSWLR
jgi:hypothetical protein